MAWPTTTDTHEPSPLLRPAHLARQLATRRQGVAVKLSGVYANGGMYHPDYCETYSRWLGEVPDTKTPSGKADYKWLRDHALPDLPEESDHDADEIFGLARSFLRPERFRERGIDPAVTRRAIEKIVERLEARRIPVMLAGMYATRNLGPEYVGAFESLYREIAEKHGLVLYPFFLDGIAGEASLNLPDGLHPTARGVAVIVGRILPSVELFLSRING